MPFLTVSNKNIFLKTQSTRLGATVAPNKSLEYTLAYVHKGLGLKRKSTETKNSMKVIEKEIQELEEKKVIAVDHLFS